MDVVAGATIAGAAREPAMSACRRVSGIRRVPLRRLLAIVLLPAFGLGVVGLAATEGLVPADRLAVAGAPLAHAAELFTELRTFPGVVLVPPPELAPFSALEPWRVELNRPRPGSTAIMRGRYLVQYR